MTGAALSDKDILPEQRLRLAGSSRRATDEGRRLQISVENWRQIAASEHLPDAVEQSEMFVAAVARLSGRFGATTPAEHAEAWTSRLYLPSWGAVVEMMHQLSSLLRPTMSPDGPVAAPTGKTAFQLTLEGWRHMREVRAQRRGNQAFVAMWFHGSLRPAYADGIKLALEETGYAPYRVDFAHHNRRIDDEIMAQIRDSRLLVADATGARASVYFEAGFADGLGIPVIWCCNTSQRARIIDPTSLAPDMPKAPKTIRLQQGWFDCVAFDTNHLPFVLWDEPGDLRKQLADRIRGLGLSRSQ